MFELQWVKGGICTWVGSLVHYVSDNLIICTIKYKAAILHGKTLATLLVKSWRLYVHAGMHAAKTQYETE